MRRQRQTKVEEEEEQEPEFHSFIVEKDIEPMKEEIQKENKLNEDDYYKKLRELGDIRQGKKQPKSVIENSYGEQQQGLGRIKSQNEQVSQQIMMNIQQGQNILMNIFRKKMNQKFKQSQNTISTTTSIPISQGSFQFKQEHKQKQQQLKESIQNDSFDGKQYLMKQDRVKNNQKKNPYLQQPKIIIRPNQKLNSSNNSNNSNNNSKSNRDEDISNKVNLYYQLGLQQQQQKIKPLFNKIKTKKK